MKSDTLPASMRRALTLALAVAAAWLPTAPARAASITAQAVKTGLSFPAAFTVGPANGIWYGERFSGEIRVIGPKRHADSLFFKIPKVAGDGEQGLLGLALDPGFPKTPFVYAYATRNTAAGLHDQILRIKDVNGDGQGMTVIFSSATTAGVYHDGGHIAFGPDGMLWAVQGEAHNAQNAQDLSNAAGKVLRMTPLGKPAPGNPFTGSRIWSYGLRNSYGFAFDPQTGRLWETENGPECNDELNRIVKGGNYGWGYTPTIAPTGAVFCHGCGLGSTNEGNLFFGAYNEHDVRRVVLTSNRLGVASQAVVYNHGDAILSMQAGPDGTIYFSDTSGIWRLTLG